MALDWLPIYPDLLLRVDTSGLFANPFTVENLDPIPRPAPPTELTWLPRYPDWIAPPRSLDVSAQQAVARWWGLPLFDFRWWPILPDWLEEADLDTALQQTMAPLTPSTYPAIAVRQAWEPQIPALFFAPPPLTQGTPHQLVIPLAALVDSTVCVQWGSEAVTVPDFLTETTTAPDFLAEALTRPALTTEGIC